jgi:hypothetical protein
VDQVVLRLNQKAAEEMEMYAQIVIMIAALSHQVKTGDGMSHKLAQMVTTQFLKGVTNANTSAALMEPILLLDQKAADLTNVLIGVTTAVLVMIGENLRAANKDTIPETLVIANMNAAQKEMILLLMMAADLTYAQTMVTIAALNLLE